MSNLHDAMTALMGCYQDRALALEAMADATKQRAEECRRIAADIKVELGLVRTQKGCTDGEK